MPSGVPHGEQMESALGAAAAEAVIEFLTLFDTAKAVSWHESTVSWHESTNARALP